MPASKQARPRLPSERSYAPARATAIGRQLSLALIVLLILLAAIAVLGSNA